MRNTIRKKWIIWITIALLIIGVSAAFAYGKTSVQNKAGKSYYDSLNEYDWSNTCPGASCRNRNQESQ